MGIEKARNGDVEIAYESIGSPDGIPLLLIMGSGGQMVMWHNDFCAALAERGFHVVRMDNRDAGLSTHLRQFDNARRPLRRPAYTLDDLADDVIAVVDALGWSGAHLVGASFGGLIAQKAAVRHPDRVRSLTSMSSSASTSFRLNRPKLGVIIKMFKIMRRDAADRDAEGEKWVALQRLVGSPAYPVDEEHWREAARLAYDRGINPAAGPRQIAATLASGDRRRELSAVRVPALVIHGEADPLYSMRAARATAEAIPGARFVSYPGVGHDLPREIWPSVIDEISALALRADGVTSGAADH